MTGLTAILTYKTGVDERLLSFLTKKQNALVNVNAWGKDAVERLKSFVIAGKTIRGCLVVYTYQLFQNRVEQKVYDAGAGIELIHSGLLIHDDIMDRDSMRRGQKAIHEQFGVDIAISVADLCFFLGYELLPQAVYSIVSAELQSVAVAQMQDVKKRKLTDDERTTLYRYKTARYTFSLPMMVGATLAAKPTSSFEKLGESLGLLYQIRDDELDHEETLLSKQKILLLTQSERQIKMLPIDEKRKDELTALTLFCLSRKK